MSIVAPIAATGVVLPVLAGIISGERPGVVRLVGVVVAIVGVVLSSRQPDDGTRVASSMGLSVLLALVAAVGFGGEFILLSEASKGEPLWGGAATLAAYLLLLVIAAGVAVARGAAIAPQRSTFPWLLALGLTFGGANAFFALATRHGELAAVAVSASLYPVVTVILARVVLKEHVRRVQEVGIVAALAGIMMIAAG